jgi:ABC-2 type transport system ATP-binding protein
MLKIKNLSFSYGKLKVFENFNLHIPENQACLITGINGVGKSTLLRLIAGVLKPDHGEIAFDEDFGVDPRRKIGFISDVLSLYESMTVSQAMEYHKSAYALSGIDDNLIRKAKIGDSQRIKELSTGQRTLLHLSLVLSTEPRLFLIDEIIHSIDAFMRRLFLEQLIQILSTRQQVTVIMVNLNFHDIERIVERVVLLKAGKIAVDEGIDELKAKVKKIVASSPPKSQNVLSKIDFTDHSEYFVYPVDENSTEDAFIDLNLTEIIAAFIGGEYA